VVQSVYCGRCSALTVRMFGTSPRWEMGVKSRTTSKGRRRYSVALMAWVPAVPKYSV
jgi:hypothetical protein